MRKLLRAIYRYIRYYRKDQYIGDTIENRNKWLKESEYYRSKT